MSGSRVKKNEEIKRYYCDDCHSFVDKNHRCQQWETVRVIPKDITLMIEQIWNIADEVVRLSKENDTLTVQLEQIGAMKDQIERLTEERELFRENYKELLNEAKNLYVHYPNSFRKKECEYFKEENEFILSMYEDTEEV